MSAARTLALLTIAEEQQAEHAGSRDRALYVVIDRAAGLQSWPAEAKARLYSLAIEHAAFNGTSGNLETALGAALELTRKEFT